MTRYWIQQENIISSLSIILCTPVTINEILILSLDSVTERNNLLTTIGVASIRGGGLVALLKFFFREES